MSEPVWYRSLYWRIALGFFVLVATLLSAQGLFSLWLTGRVAAVLPGRTPAQFAESIATELSVALGETPDLDAGAFLREHRPNAAQAYAVVLRDGRTAVSEHVAPPPNALRAARIRLTGLTGQLTPGGRGPDGGRGGRFGRGTGVDPPGRGGRGGPALEFATVVSAGEPFGIVAVPSAQPPLSVALLPFVPTLATVGFVLLVVGTTAAALLVFRPAHRRLRDLEQAARALGSGDASARAIETGGDEVASLAHTFNEMAEDLHIRAAALVEADRTRRQLLADISHELATPLSAIRGYAETLAMPSIALDEPTRRRYLDVITEETDRLAGIVGDLLDLARLEGGGVAFKREPVGLAAIFDRVRDRHEPVMRDHRITLVRHLVPDDLVVPGDANRLEQALQNLAANAVRHTPDGGRVVLRGERVGDEVQLTVEDTGPGIPADHLPHVFDRFYKADVSRTGTAIPSGSGLGLSIVQAIVGRHGGRVSAANGEGGGARFDIILPAKL